MDAITLLKTAGQIAGIGGIALVVLLLLYRDIIRMKFFPQLTKDQGYRLIRLTAVMVFLIALAGLGSWVWVEQRPVPAPVTAIGGVAAGGDVDAGKIDIRPTDIPTPASDTHSDGGVTAEGGVAAGGNVNAEEIKIGDP